MSERSKIVLLGTPNWADLFTKLAKVACFCWCLVKTLKHTEQWEDIKTVIIKQEKNESITKIRIQSSENRDRKDSCS
jgi:hypothetical protein